MASGGVVAVAAGPSTIAYSARMNRFAFAFAIAFALAACGPEEPVVIEESPTLGVCRADCSALTWEPVEAAGTSTCCDCRRVRAELEDLCNDTLEGGSPLEDQAVEQCPDCNDL